MYIYFVHLLNENDGNIFLLLTNPFHTLRTYLCFR